MMSLVRAVPRLGLWFYTMLYLVCWTKALYEERYSSLEIVGRAWCELSAATSSLSYSFYCYL